MASIVTHLVFSEQVYPGLFSDFRRQEFLIGTGFPDIRYLGTIKREMTHFEGITLNGVLAERDSFTAGMKFHSLLDMVREAYIVEQGVYSIYPESKHTRWSLKFLEDEIYYDHISDWKSISSNFHHVLEAEKRCGINEDQIMEWHRLIQEYILSKPTDDSRRIIFSGIGFDQETSDTLISNITSMRNDKELVEVIHGFYSEFLKKVKK